MIEHGALPKPSAPTAPVKSSSPFAAKNSTKSSGFAPKSTVECANFPHKSLPVVVLGASPLKNGVFFPAKNSADFSGRASKVKVVLRESGHVDRTLSGTVCSWSSPVNALTAEVRRGNGNTGLAALRKWLGSQTQQRRFVMKFFNKIFLNVLLETLL